jgi:hypothetical protein
MRSEAVWFEFRIHQYIAVIGRERSWRGGGSAFPDALATTATIITAPSINKLICRSLMAFGL